ncbi:MAG: hypothetical protein R3B70_06895 [Polyangiaceae bacterium]
MFRGACLFLPLFFCACGGNTVTTTGDATTGDPGTGGSGATTATGGSGGATGGTGGSPTGVSGGAATGGAGGMFTGGAGGTTTGTTTGPSNEFPGILAQGPWLFGWAGGLDHFSWLRFDFANETQGALRVLGSECGSCIPLYECKGTGLFSADPVTNELILQLPSGCNNESHTFIVGPFTPASGFPPSALLSSMVTGDQGEMLGLFQYPSGACSPDFSTCQDPFN